LGHSAASRPLVPRAADSASCARVRDRNGSRAAIRWQPVYKKTRAHTHSMRSREKGKERTWRVLAPARARCPRNVGSWRRRGGYARGDVMAAGLCSSCARRKTPKRTHARVRSLFLCLDRESALLCTAFSRHAARALYGAEQVEQPALGRLARRGPAPLRAQANWVCLVMAR
jgi:hypothetical protein